MADVWLGILNRFVEKFLNVKGGPTVVDFNHQVQLMIPVFIGVEERFHQGWTRFGLTISATGLAGDQSGMMLHNPLTNNAIAVVERIGMGSTAAAGQQMSVSFQGGPAGIADLTTIQTPANFDGRSTVGSSMILSTSTNTVPFARFIAIGGTAGPSQEMQFITTENQEITLIPGSAVQLNMNALATQGTFTLWWRERPLETSELT